LTKRKGGRSLKEMRRIQAAGARQNFSSLVKKSQAGERIKLTRYNKTAAILIPKRDLEHLEECEKETASTGSKRARGAR
jgi:prevent-host-death family protein